jgi:hypothetical protein
VWGPAARCRLSRSNAIFCVPNAKQAQIAVTLTSTFAPDISSAPRRRREVMPPQRCTRNAETFDICNAQTYSGTVAKIANVRFRRAAGVGLVLAAAMAFSACEAKGGGWVGTSQKNAKINLGFNLECDATGDATDASSISYIDRSVGLSIKILPTNCSNAGTTWSGTYRPRPRGEIGTAVMTFTDSGKTGPSKGDGFTVTLTGGLHDGYTKTATLDGGNITITE